MCACSYMVLFMGNLFTTLRVVYQKYMNNQDKSKSVWDQSNERGRSPKMPLCLQKKNLLQMLSLWTIYLHCNFYSSPFDFKSFHNSVMGTNISLLGGKNQPGSSCLSLLKLCICFYKEFWKLLSMCYWLKTKLLKSSLKSVICSSGAAKLTESALLTKKNSETVKFQKYFGNTCCRGE